MIIGDEKKDAVEENFFFIIMKFLVFFSLEFQRFLQHCRGTGEVPKNKIFTKNEQLRYCTVPFAPFSYRMQF
jgi:hypothetical protein